MHLYTQTCYVHTDMVWLSTSGPEDPEGEQGGHGGGDGRDVQDDSGRREGWYTHAYTPCSNLDVHTWKSKSRFPSGHIASSLNMHVACSETNKLLGNIYDKFAQVETPSAKLATEGEALQKSLKLLEAMGAEARCVLKFKKTNENEPVTVKFLKASHWYKIPNLDLTILISISRLSHTITYVDCNASNAYLG